MSGLHMQAVEIATFGGPEVLQLATRPRPVAGEGEVLVRVSASGINRPDVLQRMGRYAPPAGTSDIPVWKSPVWWRVAMPWPCRLRVSRPETGCALWWLVAGMPNIAQFQLDNACQCPQG